MASTSRSGYDASGRELFAIGVTTFAGVLMATVALFQILQGIAAIAKDDVFVTGFDYQYKLDVSNWGWLHLVLGVIALVTGVGILAGQAWAGWSASSSRSWPSSATSRSSPTTRSGASS